MQLRKDTKYTYADYAGWDTAERYELIDGVPYMMSPAPSTEHQRIGRQLLLQLGTYLTGKSCEVFNAPFDVRLNADTEDDTVVQPDLAVICDPKKIDASGCKGAPDMVVEIVSPSSVKHDQFIKQEIYRLAGVREYWIVFPEFRNVQVYLLKDGEYMSKTYADKDSIPVHVLEDCTVNLADVFPVLEAEESEAGENAPTL